MSKKIVIEIMEDGNVSVSDEGFENTFEVNGLLQTVLTHKMLNAFGLAPEKIPNIEPEEV